MDKVTGLQDETRRCLQRLDELSRVLKKAARDVQQQPPLKQSPSMGVEISQRMENLANIESNIEFARCVDVNHILGDAYPPYFQLGELKSRM